MFFEANNVTLPFLFYYLCSVNKLTPREPLKSFQSFCLVYIFKEYFEIYLGFSAFVISYGYESYFFQLSSVVEPEFSFKLLEVFGEENILEVN